MVASHRPRQSARELGIPFPKAPIEVGAKWSVTRAVETQGVTTTYDAVYEFTKLEDGQGTVTANVERATQAFHAPKTEQLAGNRFNRMKTSTTATLEFSLEKIVPETKSLESTTNTHMVIEFPISNMAVVVKVDASRRLTFSTPLRPKESRRVLLSSRTPLGRKEGSSAPRPATSSRLSAHASRRFDTGHPGRAPGA